MEETVGTPNGHYALPQCEHLDESAGYAARACGRSNKGRRNLLGFVGEGGVGKVKSGANGKSKSAYGMSKPAPVGGARSSYFIKGSVQRVPASERAAMKHALMNKPKNELAAIKHALMMKQKPRRQLGLRSSAPIGMSTRGAAGRAAARDVSVAVCLSGQLRVMVPRGLHRVLKKQLVDVLHADMFVHVDTADTRAWGSTRDVPRAEYEEVVRVLQPKAGQLISYKSPQADPTRCDASVRGSGGARVCVAHDCGSFTCGCYVPGCTHCDVSPYIPQHAHTKGCLEMIVEEERRRGRQYALRTPPSAVIATPSPPPSP